MILLIKTDQEDAFVGLHDNERLVSEKTWVAHKQLSDTLLKAIEDQLQTQSIAWSDIQGIVCYKGPGSFTGLRIGATVANTLAESVSIPIVGTNGDEWLEEGISRLHNDENDQIVLPEYGGDANITKPRK